jgi:ribosome biogenesis GTPase A
MSRFGWVAHKVIDASDIVIEVLDARFINETINQEVESKVKLENKILIRVVNKSDFLNRKQLNAIKKELDCIFVSTTKHTGIPLLKRTIKMLVKKNKIQDAIVGVLGYPNVGKSSLINVFKGRQAARTSPDAGYTKGKQYVRISKNIMMIDTPGVIPKEKKNENELVLIGAKNPHTIKDSDIAAMNLMQAHPGLIEKKYGVIIKEDKEETIGDIAIKLNMKKKGNLPDVDRAARKILKDWIG